MRSKTRGFTIVELLVVIVVIGVLAAIIIVSFTGISGRAVSASIQSDLSNSANQLKMYYTEHGAYPSTISDSAGGYCPTPADTKYCLKATAGNDYSYISASPYSTFILYSTNTNGTKYRITPSSKPVAVVIPPNSTDNGDGTYTTLIYSSPADDGYMGTDTCDTRVLDPVTNANNLVAGSMYDTDNGCVFSSYRTLQRFNISAITGGVSTATYNVYLYNIDGNDNLNAILQHVPDFATIDTTDYDTTPYDTVGVIATPASTLGMKSVSVTTQVTSDASESREFSSFRTQASISAYNYQMFYYFYSANNATNKPYLSVTWTP